MFNCPPYRPPRPAPQQCLNRGEELEATCGACAPVRTRVCVGQEYGWWSVRRMFCEGAAKSKFCLWAKPDGKLGPSLKAPALHSRRRPSNLHRNALSTMPCGVRGASNAMLLLEAHPPRQQPENIVVAANDGRGKVQTLPGEASMNPCSVWSTALRPQLPPVGRACASACRCRVTPIGEHNAALAPSGPWIFAFPSASRRARAHQTIGLSGTELWPKMEQSHPPNSPA